MNDVNLVNDQVRFISKLLMDNELNVIQHSLKTALIVIADIIILEHNLDKLYYAVMAAMYIDSIKIMKECRSQLEIYNKEQNDYYIKKLYDNYKRIMEMIQKKLVEEFNINTSIKDKEKELEQINNICELIELLDEGARNQFMTDLCKKICSKYPIGDFAKKFDVQLGDVYHLIADERYAKLEKWNIRKYIVMAWCDRLSESIFKENVQNININMMKQAQQCEKSFIKYGVSEDIIMIAFDKYRESCINKLLVEYKIPTIVMTIDSEGTKFKFVEDFLIGLKSLDRQLADFITKRNIIKIVAFYDKIMNEFMNKCCDFYIAQKDILVADTYTIITKNLFKQIEVLNEEIKKKYNEFTPIKLGSYKNKIYNIYYNKYKYDCNTLVNNSLNKHLQNNVMKKAITSAGNLLRENIITDGKERQLDTSSEIEIICKIIKKAKEIDVIIETNLLNDIKKEYEKHLFDKNVSTKYNNNIYFQVLIDLSEIKNGYSKSNTNERVSSENYATPWIMSDLELKIKQTFTNKITK